MKILITGITGFIGSEVCKNLLKDKKNIIRAIIRPKTSLERYEFFQNNRVKCLFGDLADKSFIQKIFKEYAFDIVFHIGALRGGRNFPQKEYYRVNVNSTEYIAKECLKQRCKLIFCSSVGVFGAIPKELPPREDSPRQSDNYYHYTKITAEKVLQKLKKKDLNYVIIRPSITYGIGDFGFPYSLIKLVDNGLMVLTTKKVQINMVDIKILTVAFINAATKEIPSGSVFNISDRKPVYLNNLVDFISINLKNKTYPKIKKFPYFIFRIFEFIFTNILKNELWKARIQLISKSWYYDPLPAIKQLDIKPLNTIPNFRYVIEWYKKIKK